MAIRHDLDDAGRKQSGGLVFNETGVRPCALFEEKALGVQPVQNLPTEDPLLVRLRGVPERDSQRGA
ncbi:MULTISPECIES: hypothetical protein [Streptomyces]|uniref:Uncharacterized protein n=1 Tax=Streptomyces ramulosus TaxID=47762 RepID=A0ABW1FF91_9ACTN